MNIEQIEQAGGNKQTPAFNSSFQCKNRVMTYNNYPDDIFEQIKQHLVPLCEKYVFGKEVGEKVLHTSKAHLFLKRRCDKELYINFLMLIFI